jgi:hypothetical protein
MDRLKGIAALCAVGLTVLATQADAANRGWTGGAGNNQFSDPRNWGGTLPNAADRLVFAFAAAATLRNDMVGASFQGLDFTGPGNVVLTGNALTLTSDHPITVNVVAGHTAGTFLIDLDVTIPTPAPVIELQEGLGGVSSLTFEANRRLTFGGGIVQLWAAGLGSHIRVDAQIGQTAHTELELRGSFITLGAENSFTGRVMSYADSLTARNGGAFGPPTPSVISLMHRGMLTLVGGPPGSPVAYNEGFMFDGDAGTLRTEGDVVLGGLGWIMERDLLLEASGDLRVDFEFITGFRTLSTRAIGASVITLNNPLTFNGTLAIREGTLRAENASLPARAAVVVDPQATLELGETHQTAREFACSGTLSFTPGGMLRSGAAPPPHARCRSRRRPHSRHSPTRSIRSWSHSTAAPQSPSPACPRDRSPWSTAS